ncbi:MAG: cohesin domain-containing protein, partial [Nitrospirota bacterium]
MKKAKIVFMLFAAFLLLSANAYATEVSLPDLNVDPLAAVNIPINVDDGAGLAGYQFTVTYDAAVLTCTGAQKGSLTQGWDTPTVNATIPGQITVLSIDPSLVELGSGGGSLVILVCTAADNPGGTTSLHFDVVAVSDGEGNPVPATSDDGSLTINGGCADNDSDGYGVCPDCGVASGCTYDGDDCDDTNNAVNPGATEICNNVDDDCDIVVDEDANGDPLTRPTTCGVGACESTGTETCTSGVWGNDTCTPGTPGTEVCNNIDDDCNGTIDDGIAPVPTTCGVGACAASGEETCVNGVMVDNCTPGSPTSDDNCDGEDQDCDGTADEDYVPTPTVCGVGACESTGEMVCTVNHVLANTCVPGLPGTEGPFGDATCSDAVDNDCDGAADGADIDCAALREVSAPAVSVLVNENIQIPVNIDDATGIAGYQFTVTYDPAVLDCTSVVNGTLTGSWDAPTVNAAAGQISFISTEPNLIPLAGGSGSLALIECLVLNNPGASTAVTFTESILSDENGNPVPAQATAGSVTVSTCVPSGTDDNCDGEDQDCDGTADEDYVPTPTVCGVGACESTGEMVCTVN